MSLPPDISIFSIGIPIGISAGIYGRYVLPQPYSASAYLRVLPARSRNYDKDESDVYDRFEMCPRIAITIGGSQNEKDGFNLWITKLPENINLDDTTTTYDDWGIVIYRGQSDSTSDFTPDAFTRIVFEYDDLRLVEGYTTLENSGVVVLKIVSYTTAEMDALFLKYLKTTNTRYSGWVVGDLDTRTYNYGNTLSEGRVAKIGNLGFTNVASSRISDNGYQFKQNKIFVIPLDLTIGESSSAKLDIHTRFDPMGDVEITMSPGHDLVTFQPDLVKITNIKPKKINLITNTDADHVDTIQTFDFLANNTNDLFANNDQLRVVVIDPNTPHVLIDTNVVRLLDGGSTTYGVRLHTQPTHDVIITITRIEHTGEISTDVTSLTFTPGNWSIVQTVTVNSTKDTSVDLHYAIFAHNSKSTDSGYDNIYIPSVLALEVNPVDLGITDIGDEIALPKGDRYAKLSSAVNKQLPNEGYIEEIDRDITNDTVMLTIRGLRG